MAAWRTSRNGLGTAMKPPRLAGGLNLYGFAVGDPVNYTDPFGLRDCNKRTGEGCSAEYQRLLGRDTPLEAPAVDPAAIAADIAAGGTLSLAKAVGDRLLAAFTESTIEDVVTSSSRAASSQMTKGAQAIAKKIGHSSRGGYKSAFEGVAATQENAEELVRGILANPSRVVTGEVTMDIYDPLGRGVRIRVRDPSFVGFLEASRASG